MELLFEKTLDKIGILWYNIRSKDLKDKSFGTLFRYA